MNEAGKNQEHNNSKDDDGRLFPSGFFKLTQKYIKQNIDPNSSPQKQDKSETHNEDARQEVKEFRAKKFRNWCERWGLKPDRLIELVFSGAIVIFAGFQYFNTRANNQSTSSQTERLISAAKYSAYAADRPALRDRSYCYFHDPSRTPRQRDRRRYRTEELRHAMAVALRDPGNIQQMLSAVILALAEDKIGVYKAQTLLHALQLASSLNGNNLEIIPLPPEED